MKRKADAGHEIIIKRQARKGHQAAHGGAWKVAFADFTLAMMALFMVLWIVQPRVDEQSRPEREYAHIALFSEGAGVFDGVVRVPLELDGIPVSRVPSSLPEPASQTTAGAPDVQHRPSPQEQERAALESLAELLARLAEQQDAAVNLEVQVVPQGLRILIRDDAQRAMFARGSARLEPRFETLLQGLARLLAGIPNKLIVSGHTDSAAYRRASRYDNWNLSGERALRARDVLVGAGLDTASLLQVSAQADVMPLLPDDPQSGRNRRIELLVLTRDAERLYRQLFGNDSPQAVYPQA
ncbi:OmpA family protein [Pseudomonas sp. HR96]|uniref:OmpA family protein n=1 Tax=Pseudomonas sp. HR96 TaxID=1027966 RepID=UPI002A7528E5|nr:OmpA family protein [Pseudomonas sp. HR96]WPP00063.1 OmpA family protein [Pseudomonas sp. HR96]